MMHKPVNIQRDFYTMTTVDNDSAVITMYGEIVEQQPTDWWGDPIEGQFIIESEFLEDLEQVSKCSEITIRMNSCGGDAGVSVLIHNRLRELANSGKKLTCIVDGVAMSGGSLIMCACDTVKVNPSSLIMIHKCWSFLFGGYNADELRSMAKTNDAYDKSQIQIYQRKSTLSETVISHMMSETTYMTGKEAVDKGFADEVLDDAEPLDIAASADGRSIFVRGREMHLTPGMFAPDTIPTVNPEAHATVETNKIPPVAPAATEGGNTMATTVKELRDEFPELVAQIEADVKAGNNSAVEAAVNAERKRIEEIDEIGDLFDNELVNSAKYGENACTAQELALRAAQQAKKNGHNFMTNLESDAGASGTANVGAAPGTEDDPADGNLTDEQLKANAKAEVAKLFGKQKEE